MQEPHGYGYVRLEYGRSKEVNSSALTLSARHIKAILSPFPPTVIQPSSVELEPRGYGHVRLEYGHNKEVNSSAQALSVTQIKAILFPFQPTVIQPSSVDRLTTPTQELHGYGHVRLEYGHNKEINSSAQALSSAQIKALLSPFPPTVILPSLVGGATTPMQEPCGYGHVRPEYGHSKEVNSSAQALSATQFKALLSRFLLTGILPSSVDFGTTPIKEPCGYGHVRLEYGHSKEVNSSAQALSATQFRDILSPFHPTVIQPSSVECGTTPV
jgi:hypothetical protein